MLNNLDRLDLHYDRIMLAIIVFEISNPFVTCLNDLLVGSRPSTRKLS